jgi:hypothetical protein
MSPIWLATPSTKLQLTPLVSLVSGSKVMDKVLQQTVSSALVAVALLFSTNSKTVPSTN